MGIKKLFTFLDNNKLFKIYPYLNDLIKELDLDKKKFLIGIDGNLFCYKYSHSYNNMLIGFFNQILKFLSNGIIPLYIFDGGTIQEKENTNLIRGHRKYLNKIKLNILNDILSDDLENEDLLSLKKKLEKNTIKINIKEISILLELLDILNIPYIFSHGEGEYLAVLLNKYNIIDMLLTDDTDPIPAGINKIVKFYNNNVYYLNIKNIYTKFDISYDQLCDFCILLGSDYMVFNTGLKPNELLEKIKLYKDIETIIKENIINNINESSLEIINKIRVIYNKSSTNEKILFIDPTHNINNIYNNIIDHSNINYYSNIMLEYWDKFIKILHLTNEKEIISNSESLKSDINNFIRKKKINLKSVNNFLRNNIEDITDEELKNANISLEYLNSFII